MKDLANQIAVSEALNQKLGVTQQVLAVHKLAMQDDAPVVLHVEENGDVGPFCFYFGIENEPYYFVIVVRPKDGELIAVQSYIESAVKVSLVIRGTLLEPSTITERVKLLPTRTHRMGESRHLRNPRLKFPDHFWCFEPQQNIPGALEDKLKFLLDQLEPAQPMISGLQDECNICIIIYYEGYKDWMGGWGLDKVTMRRLAALGVDINLDLQASGPDLPDPD